MQNIEINEIKGLKEELEKFNKDEALYIKENGHDKYVLLPIELYEQIEDYLKVDEDEDEIMNNSQIRIINANNFELTYDEYEMVKKQIMDAFEKTFKPKPEKLN